ncbi:hypothetical protein [Bradyrhizobium sp. 197]|uniref:hypothetical protein n=1 Tax=Bradyrhizobium sp. 197 TaxID=2782663 RepID=UPI001FFBF254|nr:hypothetical protein [Bradyrhizobium sp. 197]
MPRYLSIEQVNRLIAAGDGDAGARRPDRAIVLLVRLGLRAGDAAQLRLTEIEWQTGSLRKSRYEVRLPLPQDLGDATAAYLDCRPSSRRNDVLFLRRIAPCRPLRRGDGISSVVKLPARLDQIINMKHELVLLARKVGTGDRAALGDAFMIAGIRSLRASNRGLKARGHTSGSYMQRVGRVSGPNIPQA